ncbi:MAG: site-specific integrase [Actinobacteria bacterium]|nr:site-specific integrase [Actinomycetota bacterium]
MPALGHERVADLTTARLERLYADLLAHGRKRDVGPLSRRTVEYVHAILRKALADAERQGIVARNVAAQARLARQVPGQAAEEAEDGRLRYWTSAEAVRFMDYLGASGDRLTALWAFMLGTGARRGEALGLCWGDLSLDDWSVTIRRALTTSGLTSPKSGISRTVDLDPGLVETLRFHLKAQDEERRAWGQPYRAEGYVFPWEDGRPLAPDYVTKALPRLARAAGVPPLHVHGLRHTHAAGLLSAGVPLFVVSRRLGHATYAVTSDTYGHLVPGANRAAAEAWADLLRRARMQVAQRASR